MTTSGESDPRHHVRKMQMALEVIQTHLRDDIQKVSEPQFRAMFETSAEVIGALIKTFKDYEEKSESAWRQE